MVVPDSRVTGPAPNAAAPTTRETAATTSAPAMQNARSATYFTPSSRVRPAGTVSR